MPEPKLGWWLSSEEHDPRDLVRHAQLAESAGFPTAMLSDHLLHGFAAKATPVTPG